MSGLGVLLGLKKGKVFNPRPFKAGRRVYFYRVLDPPVYIGTAKIEKVDALTRTLTFTGPLPDGVKASDFISVTRI
jgi:hypothetical protein